MNTHDALAQALRRLPPGTAYQDVRYHLRAALLKLERLEKKEERRSAPPPTPAPITLPSLPADQAISLIDQMITQEQKKLQEMRSQKGKNDLLHG